MAEPRAITDGPGPVLSWVADVPLVNNPVVLRAGALVFAGAFGMIAILFAVILGIDGELDRLPAAVAAMLLGFAIVLVLVLAVALLVFRNRMRCRFVLDDIGFGVTLVDRKAAFGVSLALLAGAGSGDATLTGAGLAGRARGREDTRWDRVAGVEFRPGRRSIAMKAAGWWPVGRLHCGEDSYAEVAERVARIALARGMTASQR